MYGFLDLFEPSYGGIFNLMSTTAGIENLIDYIQCPCSALSAQPYPSVQLTWWKTLWRTSGIFIVAYERISIRSFFPASPELAGILPSCVTSSKLKLWDDQQCHSGDGWNDILLILNHFNCPIAKYKVIEEGSLACKSLLLSFSSSVSAGCQTCFAYQGSMSLEERTWWETAIFYFSWHICLSIFKKWNVNCSYYHL